MILINTYILNERQLPLELAALQRKRKEKNMDTSRPCSLKFFPDTLISLSPYWETLPLDWGVPESGG